MVNLAIFISGTGTNALQLLDNEDDYYQIKLLITSNPISPSIKAFQDKGIQVVTEKSIWNNPEKLKSVLDKENIELIVLAGWLRLIPKQIVDAFPQQIINIHPSLLPKYGGKGMYGDHVHQAVLESKEKHSGITIHYVNEAYDKGAIIAQISIPVDENDDLESLKKKIQKLEHKYYPMIVSEISKTRSQ